MTIYEMYMVNDCSYGFYITSNRWEKNRVAKVTWIEFATEGLPLKGRPPYFGGFKNPPGHPRAGKVMGPRLVRLEADWMTEGYMITEMGGTGRWTMVLKSNKMIVTKKLIEDGRSRNGGWSRKQLRLLGVEWPPEKGWQDRIIGTEVPNENVEEFLKEASKHLGPEDHQMGFDF